MRNLLVIGLWVRRPLATLGLGTSGGPTGPLASLSYAPLLIPTSDAGFRSNGSTTIRLHRRHFSSTPPATRRARRLPQLQRISWRFKLGASPQ
jgi:hypothetical protein